MRPKGWLQPVRAPQHQASPQEELLQLKAKIIPFRSSVAETLGSLCD
jgi:hypothetical protein